MTVEFTVTAFLENVIRELGGKTSWLYALLCFLVPAVLGFATAMITGAVQKRAGKPDRGEGDV